MKKTLICLMSLVVSKVVLKIFVVIILVLGKKL